MEFKCYCVAMWLEEIGTCTIPKGVMPTIGEMHYFGDELYVLTEFRVDKKRSTMYFNKVKN